MHRGGVKDLGSKSYPYLFFLLAIQAVGYFGDKDIKALFDKADVDKSGSIDYFEYERLMNMERLGDEFVSRCSNM
jgi:hypothetical protein